jgi:hypothetical protein
MAKANVTICAMNFSQVILRAVATCIVALLASCAAAPVDFRDGDEVEPAEAYVALVVHVGRVDRVDIGLTRLELGKKPSDLVYTQVNTGEVTMLKVPPGVYFLRGVRVLGGYYRYALEPRLTMFRVEPGRINYPGDWTVRTKFSNQYTSGTVADGYHSADVEIEYIVAENPQMAQEVTKRFPLLAQRLPVRFSKMESFTGEARR